MSKIIVVGAGPAGEAAARFAAKRKSEVLLIEKENLGGLCLNRGCIPSKTLLSFGKKISDLNHSPILKSKIDLKNSLKSDYWNYIKLEKDRVILKIRQNLETSLRQNKIQVIKGEAKFLSDKEIGIVENGKESTQSFEKAIISIGSQPIYPPPLDKVRDQLLNSDKALELEVVPDSMIIIGGGAVGCEFACLFNELGSKITLIEKTATLLPGEDAQIVSALRRSLEKRGISVLDSLTISSLEKTGKSWKVKCSNGQELEANEILVSVGRRPNFESMDLDKGCIKISKGRVELNSELQTSNPNVYFAGDATSLSLLAHAGSLQGEIAAANCLGEKRTYDGSLVPRCLYTWPEVASVGQWKNQAESNGIEAKTQRFFFEGSSRALAEGSTEGFIQLVSNQKSDELLGAQIIGPHATELIHILSIALKKKMLRREMKEIIFAHPTLSEGIRGALER